jgi:hypothetical protein
MLTSSGLPSDSAVEAFWKTFSPQREHKYAASMGPRRTKTNNLPAELLLIIFKLAYEQESSEQDPFWSRPKSMFLSPSLFPYAVAAVCSLWRDVMSLIPCVWTRFVIVIGSTTEIPPSAILSQLSWCRDYLIDLMVVSKNHDQHPIDSQLERVQVLSVMNFLINPHIDCFRDICLDITFSSSIPPFPDGFQCPPNFLYYLKLHCTQDDGASLDILGSTASTELQFPALRRLAIDGRNYYNACRKDSRWTAKYPGVTYLSISHFTPLPSQSFLISDFLLPITLMPNLRRLDISDVVFHPSPFPATADISLDPSHLQLRNINSFESITAIFEILGDTPNITVTHCPIGDPGPFNYNGELTLRDIDEDQDLVPILHSWEGRILRVINCPSFNDAVFDMMNAYVEEDGIRTYAHANYASKLYIQDCLNFSAAALMRFITNRSGDHLVVRISGRAPDIGDDDLTWLSESLDDFLYEPVAIVI